MNKDKMQETLNLCDFRAFVIDAIKEGHHENFSNQKEFLQSCLETFQDLKEDILSG